MPNTKSASKALRQSEKRHSRNTRFTALYRESMKNLERSAKSSTKLTRAEADKHLAKIYSRIDTLTKKNIIHPNNANHRKSKIAKYVKTLTVA